MSKKSNSICIDYSQLELGDDRLLAYKLINYFNDTQCFDRVLPIIMRNHKEKISLRDLEAFVTKYADIHTVWYSHKDDPEYILHDRYKAALTSYKKGRLDPFRRSERVTIQYKGTLIESTLGQLNFLRFLIDSMALDYIEKNYSNMRVELQQIKKTKTRKNKAT